MATSAPLAYYAYRADGVERWVLALAAAAVLATDGLTLVKRA